MPRYVGPLRSYRNISPQLGKRIMIDPSNVVIGHVTLGDDVSIWPELIAIRGDVNRVHGGARTNIHDGCVLHVIHCSERNPAGHPLIIGDEVTVGHKAMLHGCTIGNRVLIGMGSTILDGAGIEDEVVIGAGSLVASGRRLHSGYLCFGSPARRVRRLTPVEIDNLIYSVNNYVQWKDDYLNQTDKQRPPVAYDLAFLSA